MLVLLGGPAWAKPRLEVAVSAEREVVETKAGKQSARLVPATKASPGEVLHYTLRYANAGDELARNAVIDNPIPEGTAYVGGSATGDGAKITFSSDGGKTFAPALTLTYEYRLPDGKVEKRSATPIEYTHVRWVVRAVPPGASGTLGFQVTVK